MFEKSNLKKCKACGNDFAKSVVECPHCGKPCGNGLFLKIFIGLGAVAVICALAIPVQKDQLKGVQKVLSAPVDKVDVSGLVKVLNNPNGNTYQQLKSKEKEITGKIVQWQLEAMVVTEFPDHYLIVTKPTADVPGALLTIYPQNDQQKRYLNSINPGTAITIKGKIAGTLKGRVKINPAGLI
ncbi:MAG: hypothetical protein HKO68_06380 [Desulfobacterales bacterium]|nr:hypothetical protein [Deltaproteobacteria bacterium]NNL75943.1 hypothetical protein [Desulfobacterales bacterium]